MNKNPVSNCGKALRIYGEERPADAPIDVPDINFDRNKTRNDVFQDQVAGRPWGHCRSAWKFPGSPINRL
jgi:hypothetical protein